MGKYTEEELDQVIDRAAQRAVGLYMEETERRFGLVTESTSFIKQQLKNMATRNEFNELRAEVATIRHVVTDHTREIRRLDSRTTKLENRVRHD
jgi:hypothetical protein